MPKSQRSRSFYQQHPAARSNSYNYVYSYPQGYARPFTQSYGTCFRNVRTENRNPFDDIDISKKLAYILRHGAYNMNLYMDRSGYVYVMNILKLPQFRNVRENDIIRIVQENDKQRFHLTHDRNNYLMIGATQGHTLKQVDQLELAPITDAKNHPCVVHGTTYKAWKNIEDSGLKTMGRTHIHFARSEPGDGRRVISGMRNNSQVLIYIDLEKALKSGVKFFLSKNEVILSEGNKDGVISPEFFKEVLDRKTRKWPAPKNKSSTKANTVTNPDRI